MRKFITLAALSVFALSSYAQFVIKGEFRPRTEYGHGYKNMFIKDGDYGLFTSQRTRLTFDFKNEHVKTMLVLQDVRVWGNQKQLVSNEEAAVSIHEAWAEVPFSENLSLKAGRQELVYDDARFFGNVGWAQQGRSHDIALLKYTGAVDVHAGVAYNQATANYKTTLYELGGNYKAMQMLWINKSAENLSASLLFVNNGMQSKNDKGEPITAYSQTFGPFVKATVAGINLKGDFYMQTGKNAANQDLNAFHFNLEAGLKLAENTTIAAGYELLSGKAYDDTDAEDKVFNPMYGTNHAFNGFMDYFYVGSQVPTGLQNIYINFKQSFSKGFVALNLNHFAAANEISADSEKDLGIELDLFAGYNINEVANIKLGYSQMFATENMEAFEYRRGAAVDSYKDSSAETNNWIWLMLTVTPKFFDSSK